MTIIECPSCNTKYRLKLEIAEGQHVRCPGCRHVWRFLPPQPEQDAILLSESLAQAFGDEAETPPVPQLPEAESEPSYSNIMSSPVLPRQAESATAPEPAAPPARPAPSRSFRNETADDDSPFWTGARPIKAPEIPEWARKPSSGFPAPRIGAEQAEPAGDTQSDWEDTGTDYDDADMGATTYAGDPDGGNTAQYTDDEADYDDGEVAQYRAANRAGLHESVTGADYAGSGLDERSYDEADGTTGLSGEQDEAGTGSVATVASQSWVSELAEVMARREEPTDFDYRLNAPYGAQAAGTVRDDYDYDDSASLDRETSGTGDGGASEISDMARLEDADRLDAFWRETAEQQEPPAFTPQGPATSRPLDDDDSDIPIDPIYADYAQPASDRRFGSLTAMAAWGLYLTFVAGLIGGAVGFRDHLVQLLPGAATYYAQFGLPVGGAALTFQNVTYAWSERDGKPLIEVKGEVLNATGASVTVPMLNIVVKDDQAIEVASTAANITQQPLEGGSTAPFTLEFLAPPSRVSEIELTFRARQPG